jgi:hypothetical protein
MPMRYLPALTDALNDPHVPVPTSRVDADEHVMLNHHIRVDEIKQALLDCALRYGPGVARIVENLWVSSLLEVEQEARRLMQLAQRYGTARLEAACQRALYYRRDKTEAIVSWILDKALDRFPLNPYTDIRGQFRFSLQSLNPEDQDNVQSRIPRENLSE